MYKKNVKEDMKIRGSAFKKMSAVTKDGDLVNIPNMVMRKFKSKKEQDKMLTDNSICIVCNYKFGEKNIDWSDNIKAICHPFREPQINVLPDDKKLFLLSESDFIDESWVPARINAGGSHDYAIFTIDSSQGIRCKGYHLLPMILDIAKQEKVRGLVVRYQFGKQRIVRPKKGTTEFDLLKVRRSLVRSRRQYANFVDGWFEQERLCQFMKSSKFVMFPNTKDASPRMISEALVRGVPIFVNKNIYGGWKYVNDINGAFFKLPFQMDDLNKNRSQHRKQISEGIQYMMNTKFNSDNIRKNYYKYYGFENSAHRLANIINEVEGEEKYEYVFYREFRGDLEKLTKKQ